MKKLKDRKDMQTTAKFYRVYYLFMQSLIKGLYMCKE